jgi:hypothetical protein
METKLRPAFTLRADAGFDPIFLSLKAMGLGDSLCCGEKSV